MGKFLGSMWKFDVRDTWKFGTLLGDSRIIWLAGMVISTKIRTGGQGPGGGGQSGILQGI